jgi:diacylglycerol kinase family enzyme
MAYAKEIFCTASSPVQRLYAEVDGEYIGGPPVKVEIVPDMLNLLMSSKV